MQKVHGGMEVIFSIEQGRTRQEGFDPLTPGFGSLEHWLALILIEVGETCPVCLVLFKQCLEFPVHVAPFHKCNVYQSAFQAYLNGGDF